MITEHFRHRSKQRGIPLFINQLLDQYGEIEYDGHGCKVKYLTKKSIRSMERDMGREPVRRLAQWHDAYKVQSLDGEDITVGHRYNKIWRK